MELHAHCLAPAIQAVLYPVTNAPLQAMGSLFLQENVWEVVSKAFPQSRQTEHSYSLSLVHQVGHLVRGGDQVG